MLFHLGQTLVTPRALDAIIAAGQCPKADFLARHHRGDWGDLNDTAAMMNGQAVQYSERILSVYTTTEGVELWIFTEANRAGTVILLPSEYCNAHNPKERLDTKRHASWLAFVDELREEMHAYVDKEYVVGSYPCDICHAAFTDADSQNKSLTAAIYSHPILLVCGLSIRKIMILSEVKILNRNHVKCSVNRELIGCELLGVARCRRVVRAKKEPGIAGASKRYPV